MKFRTFITPLAIVGGLVFVVGLALLGGLLLRNPLTLIDQGGLQNPAAVQFVPKQSTLVASLLTRPERLAEVWEYLTIPELRKQTRQDVEQIEQTLLAGTGLDYEQDILPWLGEEITTAVLGPDFDQDLSNGADPGYLVALSCRDGEAAKSKLELFWQNRAIAGDALSFEDFAGSRLIYSTPKRRNNAVTPSTLGPLPINQLATTLVANRFVLVANHPEVLRQALNAAQSIDNNLGSDQRYRSTLGALPKTRVGLLAIHLPEAARILSGNSSEPAKLTSLAHLEEPGDVLDWGLVSLGLTREGIVGDIALTAEPGRRFEPRKAILTELPQTAHYLPASAAVTAVGQSLQTLLREIQPLWQSYGLDVGNEFWDSNELASHLDEALVQDFLNTVTDHFALGFDLDLTLDWLLAAQGSPALAEVLRQIDASAQEAGIGVNPLTIEGRTTTALTRLMLTSKLESPGPDVIARVLGLHAHVDDVSLISSSPALITTALKSTQKTPSIPDWAQDLSLFQKPNEGYIHIQWPRLQSGLSRQNAQFRLWETAAKPVLRHLKTVTLASYGRTQNLQTGRVFFQLSN